MTTSEATTDAAEADERAVFEHFATGKPLDPEVAKRVRERGQRIREEMFREVGLHDVGVPGIRELRGELPDAENAPSTVQ